MDEIDKNLVGEIMNDLDKPAVAIFIFGGDGDQRDRFSKVVGRFTGQRVVSRESDYIFSDGRESDESCYDLDMDTHLFTNPRYVIVNFGRKSVRPREEGLSSQTSSNLCYRSP
jgi:hypothetical protein